MRAAILAIVAGLALAASAQATPFAPKPAWRRNLLAESRMGAVVKLERHWFNAAH
jgi:hypothetical protein